MKRLRSSVPGVGVFCLALLVRLIYNQTVARAYYPLHDSLAYQSIGLNILREHCFCQYSHIATVYRAPLWPAIIAAIALFLVQATTLLASFCAASVQQPAYWSTFLQKMCLTGALVSWPGWQTAIYPELYIYDGWLYTESLYTFLLLAFCYGVYQLHVRPNETSGYGVAFCLDFSRSHDRTVSSSLGRSFFGLLPWVG